MFIYQLHHFRHMSKPNLNILAIIPARGGSKGLPGKNIKPFLGKPLLAYTIEEAKRSKYITKIVLSTDDTAIAQVGKKYGAEIPFLRPSELATDTSLAPDAYIYTIERLKNEQGYAPEIVVILQPTSPLRTVDDIDAAISLYLEKNADSVISVVEFEHPLERARIITPDGLLENYHPGKIIPKNRADYQKAYSPNGAIYVLTPSLLLKEKTYYFSKTYAFIIPKERSIDIDTQIDFEIAEFLMAKRK